MNSLKTLTILIVDDHPLFRKGVRELFRDFCIHTSIDEAQNGIETIKALKKKRYDIVFLDIEMPVLNGIDTAKIIVKDFPEVKILIISSYDSIRYVIELIEIGVHGYILKSIDYEKITLAVKTILENKLYLAPEIQKAWDEYHSQKTINTVKPTSEQCELTIREMQIVEEICEQNSSSTIARKLSISKSTVDNHRRNILKKLKTDNIVAVVLYAIQKGIFKIKKK